MKLQAFQGTLPESWTKFVLPEAKALVPALAHDCLAVGAADGERARGRGIGRRAAGDETTHVVSLVVAEEVRRSGIGRHLLAGLGNLLAANGIRFLAAEYMAGDNDPGDVGSFLQAAGFAPPILGVAVWNGPLNIFSDLPWIRRMPLPSRLSVEPWSALTPEQHAAVRSGEGDWYPAILSPLIDTEGADRERSLLLRDGQRVVGWMIVEPFDERTLTFTSMFVHETYRRKGRGIALMAEAFRRFLTDERYTEGIFCVEGDNADMRAFMHKHLSHPSIQENGMWRTFKSL